MEVCEVVTGGLSLVPAFVVADEDAAYWDLVCFAATTSLLESCPHPELHFLFTQSLISLISLSLLLTLIHGVCYIPKIPRLLLILTSTQSTFLPSFSSSMQSPTINLKHYVSIMTHLAFRSSQFVKECAENPSLGKYQKGADDPVTDADFKIQTYLIKGIRHFFPDLRIVGEETTDYKGEIELDFETIGLENYPEGCDFEEAVPLEELCLWIDPIDNTKGFIQGKLEGVTILIGMARKNTSYLGVVATPYQLEQKTRVFKPKLYVGCAPQLKAYQIEGTSSSKWAVLSKPDTHDPYILATSKRITNEPVDQISQQLETDIVKLGGSGRKFNMVIEGSVDAAIYINTGNCRWDSCASEAIVIAMGGLFTNQHGDRIDYQAGATEYQNKEGNVCSLDQELHKNILERYAQLKKGK